MIKLIVTEGKNTYARYFADPSITVGRAETCHLQLQDRKCSRTHCRIDRVENGHRLVDLESQNGTLVEGKRVSQKVLKPGDCIAIGEATIYFQNAPEGLHEDRRSEAAEKFASRARKLVDEAWRATGEEGLYETEKAFSEQLGKRGLSSLRQLESRYQRLLGLQQIIQALNSELQLNKLLALILDQAIEITGAARGFLIVFNREGIMEIPVARNFDREIIHKPDFKISRSIAEEVGMTGRPVLTANASEDDRFSASMSVVKLKLSSILCVPVQSPDRMLGVIYLDNPFQDAVFTREDLALLETFADQSAVALRNALLVEELRDSKRKLETAADREADDDEPELDSLASFDEEAARAERAKLRHDYSRILGKSTAMLDVLRVLDKVVASEVPVLVQGESGTGKELVARAIHENSRRKNKPFVTENCAAIAGTLLESELFGYTKGAFTGAKQDKVGLFEVADGGTLFLDEIAETSLDMQKKLLRVLQEGEFRPVGSGKTVRVDVRLITASNRDLRRMIAEGEFREDLFYRINVIRVTMPSLRDRREDIPELVEHFLSKYAPDGERPKRVAPRALAYLVHHDWPGNVRELENEIQRAVALGNDPIEPDVLSASVHPRRAADLGPTGSDEDRPLKEIVKQEVEKVERRVIADALKRADWKKNQTAKLLGISRPTLDAKIDAYDLWKDRPDESK